MLLFENVLSVLLLESISKRLKAYVFRHFFYPACVCARAHVSLYMHLHIYVRIRTRYLQSAEHILPLYSIIIFTY